MRIIEYCAPDTAYSVVVIFMLRICEESNSSWTIIIIVRDKLNRKFVELNVNLKNKFESP